MKGYPGSIRRMRRRLGLTHRRVAEIVGTSPASVCNAEQGRGVSAPLRNAVRAALLKEAMRRRATQARNRRTRMIEVAWASGDCDALRRLFIDFAGTMLDQGLYDESDVALEMLPQADAIALLERHFPDI